MSKIPYSDGSQPQSRIEKTCQLLFNYGYVDRQFSKARWKIIRQYLGEIGWIEYQDRTYFVGYWEGDKWIKGKAAKWCLSEEAHFELELVVSGSSSSIGYNKQQYWCNKVIPTIAWSPKTSDLRKRFLDPDENLRIQETKIDQIITPWVMAA